MKKLTFTEFVQKAVIVHGDKYDYTLVDYINNRTKIIILCSKHGSFEQKPDHHLTGRGCPLCAKKIRRLKCTSSTEEFINKVIAIHGNRYNYTNVCYIKNKEKVVITCPEHGNFTQNPSDHLSGKGCPKCAGQNVTPSEFIQNAIKVHGEKYIYKKTDYTNGHTKVIIECPIHGEFNQKPSSHLSGSGCPSCAEYGFNPDKPAYLYYLKVITNQNQILYKVGITNRTVAERFNLTELTNIEIVKQKLYENGAEALAWEQKLLNKYKKYQYKGPDILKSGNTELFTEDVLALYYGGT